MKTLTIRGIDEKLSKIIKNDASRKNISINRHILNILKKAAGLDKDIEFQYYNDLDQLAGTWKASDSDEFELHTKQFNKIDKDLWK